MDPTKKEDTTTEDDTTSTDDDTTEEDSEDSTESTSDEDTTDAEEDDSEDEEDDSAKYFTDPKSIPKELRGAFKKMNGIFTRRMQGISGDKKKAEAFDRLIVDEEFQTWLDKRQQKLSKGKTSSDNDDSETEDDDDDDKPLTRKDLKKLFARQNQNAQIESINKQAAEFKKNNPGWVVYKEELGEVLEKHPTMSYEEAFEYVLAKDGNSDKKKEMLAKKKAANVMKPNKTGAKEADKKGKMTFSDAFNLAKRSLTKK